MTWIKADAEHLMVSESQMIFMEEKLLKMGLSVSSLMEKVGVRMADWLKSNIDILSNGIVVLIGPGHNGGDGLVVARELFLAGYEVAIWCPFPVKKEITSQYYKYAKFLGVNLLESEPDPEDHSIWIEALFGVGQTRPLSASLSKLFQKRELSQPGKTISLDVPAGISTDNGKAIQGCIAVKASFTLTVGLYKKGLVQDSALKYVGELIRIDIGITPNHLILNKPNLYRISSSDIDNFIFPKLSITSNKYERGRLLIIAGSHKYPGAGFLSLSGAIASGVGSMRAILPEKMSLNFWHSFPEVVLDVGLGESKEQGLNLIGKYLSSIDLSRIDAILIGPGIGKDIRDQEKLFEVLADFDGLLVIDADGLIRLSSLSNGWEWLRKRKAKTWLTPHVPEFRKLFPELNFISPLDAALEASRISGATILLKGAHSVIAEPSGTAWQLSGTCPLVSRTGLGDLLAGYVAGIGAQVVAAKQISAESSFFDHFLAGSALMHAHAASICLEGSNPGEVSGTLSRITRGFQEKQIRKIR